MCVPNCARFAQRGLQGVVQEAEGQLRLVLQLEAKASYSTTKFWAHRCHREAETAVKAAAKEEVSAGKFLEETIAALEKAKVEITLPVRPCSSANVSLSQSQSHKL